MCMFGEQIPMPSAMFDRLPPDLEYDDDVCTSFVHSLAHNMRSMRKYLLKLDTTVNPKCSSKRELRRKFQMVYVKVPFRTKALQPKYAGPCIVLETKGKVLTIKWITTGKIERTSAT